MSPDCRCGSYIDGVTPLEKIQEAAAKFDRAAASEAALELADAIRDVGGISSPGTPLNAIRRLRSARYHDAAMLIAEAMFESGADEAKLRVLYAQSLIDTGRLAAALPILERVAENDAAYGEARGSLGRVYKQLFVNGGGDPSLRQQYFDRAFDAYYDFYAKTGDPWHGINAVALIELAKRRELPCRTVDPFATKMFDDLRAAIAQRTDDPWLFATAGEAAVATRQNDEAKNWYAKFASHPNVNAFAIHSALRQLQEVWELEDDGEPGSSLLPLLRAAELDRSGGEVALAPSEIAREMQRVGDANLQATFGDERAVPFAWYRKGLQCCVSVCRIEDDYDRPVGTGFVVRGGDFLPHLGDRLCILTNDHVVSEHDAKAIPPDRANARFHAVDGSPRVPIDEVLWRSGRSELDAALLSVVDDELPAEAAPYPFASQKLDRECHEKIFVIGHPQGGALSISLYDNLLLDCNETFVHYRSPTHPGSSGSPVFNDDWELVALHHAGHAETRRLDGSGTYEANEGIQIERIRAKAKG